MLLSKLAGSFMLTVKFHMLLSKLAGSFMLTVKFHMLLSKLARSVVLLTCIAKCPAQFLATTLTILSGFVVVLLSH
jgi:hypothetical protein